MSRLPRVISASGTYHVTAHGNNEEYLFLDDYDRYAYLALLTRVVRRLSVRVFAYALMSNHVHLVLQTRAANVSGVVHKLHGPYAQAFNNRYDRRGHLFGHRFHSKPIEDDVYLLEATSYVHLNPVRAGLVGNPEDYPWSSYRFYVDSKSQQTLIDVRPVLELFSRDLRISRAAYARFVRDGMTSPGTGPMEINAVRATGQSRSVSVPPT